MDFTSISNEMIQLDTDIFLFFNQLHNTYFDYFMSSFSGKWVWVPMYLALACLLKRNFNWRYTLLSMVSIALVILIADQVGASLIRPYVCRLRPANLDNPLSELVHIVNGYRGGSYGFPSCHAANTFGLTFFLIFLLRHRGLSVFFFSWAVLTCYSRIYLGVHYPGDTLAGMALGFCAAGIVYGLFVKLFAFRPKESLEQAYLPMLVGGLTVLGIVIYSGVMWWMV